MTKGKQLIVILVCLLSACLVVVFLFSEMQKTPEAPENPIEITMTVQYPDDAKKDNIVSVQKVRFNVEKGSTVRDALQLYCEISDIDCKIDSKSGAVTNISGVENGDTKDFVWMYKLNGSLADTDAASAVLHDGDKVRWVYIHTKDESASGDASADPSETASADTSNDASNADGEKS